jgi:hypothetical protein
MRHAPEVCYQIAFLALRTDAVRGGLCAILMVALALTGLPWSWVLVLPFLTYLGLRLITATIRTTADRRQRLAPRTDGEYFAACLALRKENQSLSEFFADSQAAGQLRHIDSQIDRILSAIIEDGKYPASKTLYDLINLTNELVRGYSTLVRRDVAGNDVHARVRESLATLETAYERFWEQINRDILVNLEALGEIIDFNLEGLTTLTRRGVTS